MARTDAELMEAARGGDRRALGELLERLQPRIYSFGMKMCGDPEDAKDVLQETLLAMARGVEGFRGEASLPTWLYTIARSFCIKKRRLRKGEPEHPESLDELGEMRGEGLNPEQAAAARQLEARIEQAIGTLDPRQREVLILRDVEGLSAPEVAEVLGLRIEAVKSRLHRARAAVRERLEPLMQDEACPDIVNVLSQHLEGDLLAADCAEMEKHIATCKRCDAACKSLRNVLATCRSMGEAPVPPEVAEPIRARVRELLSKLR